MNGNGGASSLLFSARLCDLAASILGNLEIKLVLLYQDLCSQGKSHAAQTLT